jgi:hypothetical protein
VEDAQDHAHAARRNLECDDGVALLHDVHRRQRERGAFQKIGDGNAAIARETEGRLRELRVHVDQLARALLRNARTHPDLTPEVARRERTYLLLVGGFTGRSAVRFDLDAHRRQLRKRPVRVVGGDSRQTVLVPRKDLAAHRVQWEEDEHVQLESVWARRLFEQLHHRLLSEQHTVHPPMHPDEAQTLSAVHV